MAADIWIGTGSDTAWTTTGNWSTGSIPVSTNDVYLSAVYGVGNILSGFSQSAVTLNSFNVDMSFVGLVGTAQAGSTATGYLNIGATTFNLGTPASGNSFRRMNLNIANSSAVVNVSGSGASANDTGYTPILLLGTTLVLNCGGGITGVALNVGETASVSTLTMASGGNGTPSVTAGAGCTLTSATVLAGVLTSFSAAASTVVVRGAGQFVYNGTGGMTALTIADGCKVTYNGTGTITSLVFAGAGSIDFSGGEGAVTVTNYTIYPGFSINDPLGRVTYTNQPTKTYVKKIQGS